MQVGADEAGKGPVLGPMIAAAVRAPPAAIPDEIDDSKRLSVSRREDLASQLSSHPSVTIGIASVDPVTIDSEVTDMNSLTVSAHVDALAAVAQDGDETIVDAGDVSESRFGRRVGSGLENKGITVDIVAAHGADEQYPIVAAASVIAKVERDRRMAAIDAAYAPQVASAAVDGVGSGYPGDGETRKFLREYVRQHGEIPDCARRSWSTITDVLAAEAQSELDDF